MQYGVGIHIRVIDIIVLKGFIGITDIAICFRFCLWSERFSSTRLSVLYNLTSVLFSEHIMRYFLGDNSRLVIEATYVAYPAYVGINGG